MSLEFYQVDSFTDKPYKGNPAAVLLLEKQLTSSQYLAIAQEFNLSETAFLHKTADGYHIRWFTPSVEVNLCGHATLAAAHFLKEKGLASNKVAFNSKSGELTATYENDLIMLDFPSNPPHKEQSPQGLANALGVRNIKYFGAESSNPHVLVEVETTEEVKSAKPNFTRLLEIEGREVILTAKEAGNKFDFISRFFAPAIGISEDPVTGAAHCCLAPYWAKRLKKTKMTGYQASARGGVVSVQVEGDRVVLGGCAITTMVGKLLNIPASRDP